MQGLAELKCRCALGTDRLRLAKRDRDGGREGRSGRRGRSLVMHHIHTNHALLYHLPLARGTTHNLSRTREREVGGTKGKTGKKEKKKKHQGERLGELETSVNFFRGVLVSLPLEMAGTINQFD